MKTTLFSKQTGKYKRDLVYARLVTKIDAKHTNVLIFS